MSDFLSKTTLLSASCAWYSDQNEFVREALLNSMFWLTDILLEHTKEVAPKDDYSQQELLLIHDTIEEAFAAPGLALNTVLIEQCIGKIRSRVPDSP